MRRPRRRRQVSGLLGVMAASSVIHCAVHGALNHVVHRVMNDVMRCQVRRDGGQLRRADAALRGGSRRAHRARQGERGGRGADHGGARAGEWADHLEPHGHLRQQ